MSDQEAVDAALAEYRWLQNADGATLADEMAIARAQGEAWRRYVALRDALRGSGE